MIRLLIFSLALFVGAAHAELEIEEFIPNSPGSREALRAFDQAYRAETHEDTMFDFDLPAAGLWHTMGGCYRASCHIFVNVVKSESPQKLYLYIDGELVMSWKVSTARMGYITPVYDGHPTGPFYSGFFSSKTYPGGDYMGLGNMPYAVFYSGDFAIHGTGAIGQLGRPASHGCVRSHPANAQYFSRLVRASGGEDVWVTVSQKKVGSTPLVQH